MLGSELNSHVVSNHSTTDVTNMFLVGKSAAGYLVVGCMDCWIRGTINQNLFFFQVTSFRAPFTCRWRGVICVVLRVSEQLCNESVTFWLKLSTDSSTVGCMYVAQALSVL